MEGHHPIADEMTSHHDQAPPAYPNLSPGNEGSSANEKVNGGLSKAQESKVSKRRRTPIAAGKRVPGSGDFLCLYETWHMAFGRGGTSLRPLHYLLAETIPPNRQANSSPAASHHIPTQPCTLEYPT